MTVIVAAAIIETNIRYFCLSAKYTKINQQFLYQNARIVLPEQCLNCDIFKATT